MATLLRILLIEDDVNDADLLSYALKRNGISYAMRRVANAHELRIALQESKPNVIVCDFSLPEFDGFEALEITGSACPDVPFFFSSGTIGEDRAQLALKMGAAGYAEKGDLVSLIAQIKPYADQ